MFGYCAELLIPLPTNVVVTRIKLKYIHNIRKCEKVLHHSERGILPRSRITQTIRVGRRDAAYKRNMVGKPCIPILQQNFFKNINVYFSLKLP